MNMINEPWCLIWCTNMTRLRDTQRAGKMLFLGVSVTMFPEDSSIWKNRLSQDGSKMGGHHPICKPDWNKKAEEGHFLSVSDWAETSAFCSQTWALLVLGFSDETSTYTTCPPILTSLYLDLTTPLAFLVLQLHDSRWWHFPVFVTTWINSSSVC